MSWSISLFGKVNKVVEKLESHGAALDGASKIEYEAAKPHLIGLVKENFTGKDDAIVKLTANGHGYIVNGERKDSYCAVSLERLYGEILM